MTFAGTDSCFFESGFLLAIFNRGNAAFHGADAVEILVEFVLIALGQLAAKILCPADDQVAGRVPGMKVRR